MPNWNVLIALIIAVAIASRLAKWPRWRKQREDKLIEVKEAFPNLQFKWIFWMGTLIMFTKLSIIALSFWYIYWLLN